jgi:hypothetical protein
MTLQDLLLQVLEKLSADDLAALNTPNATQPKQQKS